MNVLFCDGFLCDEILISDFLGSVLTASTATLTLKSLTGLALEIVLLVQSYLVFSKIDSGQDLNGLIETLF